MPEVYIVTELSDSCSIGLCNEALTYSVCTSAMEWFLGLRHTGNENFLMFQQALELLPYG